MNSAVFFLLFCGSCLLLVNGEEMSLGRNKRADDIAPLETVVQTLSQQVTQHNAKIAALEARLDKTETSVAFHVEFTADPVTLGPRAPLIFDGVRTNVGNGYDPLTGTFRAPVAGTYMVVVNYMGAIETYLYVHMLVDGTLRDYSISHGDGSTWDHVSEAMVLHLTAGQRVHLTSGHDTDRSIRGAHWSTFSGFLIQAD